jgi:DNA-binding protein Fis
VLKHTGGNKTKAAEILGIDRVSLWRKVKKFNLQD